MPTAWRPTTTVPVRFKDQKDYAEVSRRLSDKDFLVVPWEEPSVAFGGHYNIMWPKNVFWSKPNTNGGGHGGAAKASAKVLPFEESDATYGKVYHTGNAENMQRLLDAESGYWYHAHPRTKSTAGFPDATWGTKYLKSDRYLGVAFKPGMGQDNSEATMCEWRCFDAVDTMNNMNAGTGIDPKLIIADIDTYRKSPEDDTYANFPVNYLKLDTVPGPDQDWSPVLKAMRDGNFFVTHRRNPDQELRGQPAAATRARLPRMPNGRSRWRSWKSSPGTARQSASR